MFRWIRNPLTWMVVAEMIVVALLLVAAWNAVAGVGRPTQAMPLAEWPDPIAEPSRSPSPDVPSTKPDRRGPMPGLNLNSAFWQQRLRQLNREEAFFERLQWRIVHAAMDTIKSYLETVVLPSIRHVERAGGPLVG